MEWRPERRQPKEVEKEEEEQWNGIQRRGKEKV